LAGAGRFARAPAADAAWLLEREPPFFFRGPGCFLLSESGFGVQGSGLISVLVLFLSDLILNLLWSALLLKRLVGVRDLGAASATPAKLRRVPGASACADTPPTHLSGVGRFPPECSGRSCAPKGNGARPGIWSGRAARPYWNGRNHGVMQARVDEGAGPQPTLPPKRAGGHATGSASSRVWRGPSGHGGWGVGEAAEWCGQPSSGGAATGWRVWLWLPRLTGAGKCPERVCPKKLPPFAQIQFVRKGGAGRRSAEGETGGENRFCCAPPAALRDKWDDGFRNTA